MSRGPAGARAASRRGRAPGPLLAGVLGALLCGEAHPALGQPAGDACCRSEKEAYGLFVEGVRLGAARRDLEASADLLCRAACCLPEPRPDQPFTIRGAGTVKYLPYFYLGLSLNRLGDECRALASFNLAACTGEVDSLSAKLQQDLRRNLASARKARPRTAVAFGEGLEAYLDRRWGEAAEGMSQAMAAWDEDGEPARSYGRWQAERPYIPRYFLARALFELGCLEQSVGLLRCSPLGRCEIVEYEEENPQLLIEEGERRLRSPGYREPGLCARWRTLGEAQAACCACNGCGGS